MMERKWFTDYVQLKKLTAMRLCGHLAFVETGITSLTVFDLQRPIFGKSGADNTEALVGCVGVATHRQNMNVTMAYPRNLLNILKLLIKN